ncbi:MAG: hypothetical protein WC711_02950 [Candidatus Staskawiczbacteria bacterium]|jgi:hypothetical protein
MTIVIVAISIILICALIIWLDSRGVTKSVTSMPINDPLVEAEFIAFAVSMQERRRGERRTRFAKALGSKPDDVQLWVENYLAEWAEKFNTRRKVREKMVIIVHSGNTKTLAERLMSAFLAHFKKDIAKIELELSQAFAEELDVLEERPAMAIERQETGV